MGAPPWQLRGGKQRAGREGQESEAHSRYRNRRALKAWFCMAAATRPFTAKSLRNCSTLSPPGTDLS